MNRSVTEYVSGKKNHTVEGAVVWTTMNLSCRTRVIGSATIGQASRVKVECPIQANF